MQLLRYLQSTAAQMPKLLTGHGARVAEKLEELLEIKNEILALTPQLGKVIIAMRATVSKNVRLHQECARQ